MWAPSCVFRHELGASSAARWEAVARYNQGKELYFAIHHGRLAWFGCFLLDRTGALLRAISWSLPLVLTGGRKRFRDRAVMWILVLNAPIKGPAFPPDAR